MSNDHIKILIGVDFELTGEHALRAGMKLARTLPESELHVVNVLPSPEKITDAAELDALSKELVNITSRLQTHMKQVCAPTADEGAFEHEVHIHARLGEPSEAVHQAAVDIEADYIVVGTHARKGLERMVMGSVAEKLVRTAHCPVIVARPKDFEGVEKSAHVEPAREGQGPLHATTHKLTLEYVPRTSRISGLV